MQLGQTQAPAAIAEPIPLEDVNSPKQNMYKPLMEARLLELSGEVPVPVVPETPVVKDPAMPSQADKQAFLKAVLGDKHYERTFMLFDGSLEASLEDRSTKDTEKLYGELHKQQEKDKFPDADWTMWEERYQLASTLRKVRFKSLSVKEFDNPTDLKGRVLELLEFSKPVYLALMSTSRLFERQVQILTENAHSPDFWKADGSGSR